MNSLRASNHANVTNGHHHQTSHAKSSAEARARAVICAAPRAAAACARVSAPNNVKLTTVMLIGGILVYIRIPSVYVPISRLVAD